MTWQDTHESIPVVGIGLLHMRMAFTFLFLVSQLVALMFFARLFCALFSSKVSAQMCKHPLVHSLWGCLALVGVLLFLELWGPGIWPRSFIERRTQRQMVLERVRRAGGWEAVRHGCEALVTNYPDGLTWFPPSSNSRVYPHPQTEPQHYYVTNLDFGTIPAAVAALQPREIYYYPLRLLRKGDPQVAAVRIKIFGGHATGGHSTPYYGLEGPCGKGAETYAPVPSRGGVSGNRYSSYRKVVDGVFEIY
jgi:hypothetical protein